MDGNKFLFDRIAEAIHATGQGAYLRAFRKLLSADKGREGTP